MTPSPPKKKLLRIVKIATPIRLFFTIALIIGTSQTRQVSASGDLEVTVSALKTDFRLGENVLVDITVNNISNISLQVSWLPCIKVTSKKDNAFKSYAPPISPLTPFTVDGIVPPLFLRARERRSTQESILWNYKPQVSHLNEDAARPEIENRILKDYVFTEAGTYLVKGCTAVLRKERWEVVDSDPIEIAISAPAGDDLEVWNQLKQNGNIGYFLQVGDIPRTFQYKTEEREALLKEIGSILKEYPNSFYAPSLQQGLEKYRVNDAARLEIMRKMQKPTP